MFMAEGMFPILYADVEGRVGKMEEGEGEKSNEILHAICTK